MAVSELDITRIILDTYAEKLRGCTQLDVAVVGAGPSGLVAAHDLARRKLKVAVFERKLSAGGGLWGGGMLFNVAIFQKQAEPLLKEMGIRYKTRREGYLVADAMHAAAMLTAKAIEAGAAIFNGLHVEDLMVRDGAVTGLVLNWTSVEMAQLHVDPLAVAARAVVDATGHECSLAHFAAQKGLKLATRTGGIVGEGFMWAERGEEQVVEFSGEVLPGLFAAGMAASAIHGGYRMGPIFGGMLLSGRKVARLIAAKLGARPRVHPEGSP
jgi:thiamine thiazole synthase